MHLCEIIFWITLPIIKDIFTCRTSNDELTPIREKKNLLIPLTLNFLFKLLLYICLLHVQPMSG